MKSLSSIITSLSPVLILVPLLMLFLLESVFSAENIHVQNAWIREAPPAIKVMAGYLDIENLSDRALTLVSAESPEFERIEFHISQVENGVARMQQQEHIIIAPDSTLSFEPGAYHLMLFNHSVPMREGKRISINLTFEDGKTLSFDAIVRRSNLTETPHQHDHRH